MRKKEFIDGLIQDVKNASGTTEEQEKKRRDIFKLIQRIVKYFPDRDKWEIYMKYEYIYKEFTDLNMTPVPVGYTYGEKYWKEVDDAIELFRGKFKRHFSSL